MACNAVSASFCNALATLAATPVPNASISAALLLLPAGGAVTGGCSGTVPICAAGNPPAADRLDALDDALRSVGVIVVNVGAAPLPAVPIETGNEVLKAAVPSKLSIKPPPAMMP